MSRPPARRLVRLAWDVVTALSLAAFLAILVFWARSYRFSDLFAWRDRPGREGTGTLLMVHSRRGVVSLEYFHSPTCQLLGKPTTRSRRIDSP